MDTLSVKKLKTRNKLQILELINSCIFQRRNLRCSEKLGNVSPTLNIKGQQKLEGGWVPLRRKVGRPHTSV